MTNNWAQKHQSTAESHRAKGAFEHAGEYFTLAGYAQVSHRPPGRFGQSISRGLYYLLHSVVCYRLSRHPSARDQIRCDQGVLLVEDMQERLSEKPTPANEFDRARVGAWDEFRGDFATLAGDSEEAEQAYDAAKECYKKAENFDLGFAEREHRDLIQFYEDLALASGEELSDWYERKTDLSFPEWINHKREHLPAYFETVIERGKWR